MRRQKHEAGHYSLEKCRIFVMQILVTGNKFSGYLPKFATRKSTSNLTLGDIGIKNMFRTFLLLSTFICSFRSAQKNG